VIRRKRFILLLILTALFGFLQVIVFGDNGYFDLLHLKADHHTLKETTARLNQENQQLYRTIDRLKNDPVYVENLARRELGMIQSNELVFTFKHPAGDE
jgi:cell division protein FtsB